MAEQLSVARHVATYVEAADMTVWHCGDADVGHARVMGDGAVELSAPDRACWYIRQGKTEDDRG